MFPRVKTGDSAFTTPLLQYSWGLTCTFEPQLFANTSQFCQLESFACISDIVWAWKVNIVPHPRTDVRKAWQLLHKASSKKGQCTKASDCCSRVTPAHSLRLDGMWIHLCLDTLNRKWCDLSFCFKRQIFNRLSRGVIPLAIVSRSDQWLSGHVKGQPVKEYKDPYYYRTDKKAKPSSEACSERLKLVGMYNRNISWPSSGTS